MGSMGPQLLRRSLALAGALVLVGTVSPALAAPETPYQMPFPCGQSWTGTTRPNHSPSSNSIDWNGPNDMGRRVMAAAPGRVSRVRSGRTGYGRYIVIDHGKNESSLYAHLSRIRVKQGQRVKKAQLIGNVGSSGNSTGSHLHFEERVGSRVVHPFIDGRKFRFGSTLKSKNCRDGGGDDGGGDDGGGEQIEVVPLAGDWHKVGTAQLTLFRRTSPAHFVVQRPPKDKRTPLRVRMGVATDEPVMGDWDGNGNVNAGVFRPATGTFYMRSKGTGLHSLKFGSGGNQPVSGDWNGDGTTEIGVRDPKKSRFHLRNRNGSVRRVDLGDSNDLPVTGDWDRDGVTDLGVFDRATATFKLRRVDQEGTPWIATIQFGRRGDLPVVGDWDGNGRDDLGVWTPGTGKYSKRHASAPTNRTARRIETGTFRD